MSKMAEPKDMLGKLQKELAKAVDHLDHCLIDVGVPDWHIRETETKIRRLKQAIARHKKEA